MVCTRLLGSAAPSSGTRTPHISLDTPALRFGGRVFGFTSALFTNLLAASVIYIRVDT